MTFALIFLGLISLSTVEIESTFNMFYDRSGIYPLHKKNNLNELPSVFKDSPIHVVGFANSATILQLP